MTVTENVAVGAVARGRDVEGVGAVLEQTGLAGAGERLAGTLAYGLQRRVEIARALAGGPRLLLLDEPAAGMNEAESDSLLEMISALRAEGQCTIVIVDHDLRLIMRLCDRIHVLAEGRTIGEGTPAEVRSNQAVIDAYLGVAGGEGPPASPETTEGEEAP
jgi:branched-chain amino acid transport system ATP-binding protein